MFQSREDHFNQFVEDTLLPFIESFPICYVVGNQNKQIAYRYVTNIHHTKLMILVNGRGENIAKWSEIAYDFYQQGYDVLLFDHRGQGFSDRLLADKHKGYIDQFRYYIDDMDLVIQTVLQQKQYQQQVLFAHSMGGLLATYYLATYPHHIDKVILSSPFLGLREETALRDEIVVMLMVLFGCSGRYIFTKGPYKPANIATTDLTHSKARLDFMNQMAAKYPEARLGGPTFGWVHRIIIAFKKLPNLAPKIQMPMLILQSGEESIVSTNKVKKLFASSPSVHLVEIAGAKHEIMFETDEIRASVFKQIIEFLQS
ncbi:alpha/beta hydrolase [Gallibacterium salpingitidis]|uniref:alpha/beta fold hydrolase n=1 Tax=Gallibacterium salpingitidis TaxID=505341 RepID=UPI00266EFC45|nr:alpha/beta hydrolase [Gallibacterium salpingitidis]WKS99628.1 alpha/beta hydrolase [Gallibacterium salpingitidis]